ncbi:hypothetical protein FRX31_017947 [Thalictrum thalictroides]|uniref:Uncharacterized protein n=1 Tax=Thalictrum thalictroides TaxID=46969 RepID=A0A7J6W521_THATH|nr:hypothetical protein FRX31_017947 [Thalictrum thalictroides]
MYNKMQPLKALMTSEKWEAIKGRPPTAKQIHVEELLLDPMFWAEIKGLVHIMKPLVVLLRQVDGDKKPTMGFIHRWVDAALQKIKGMRGHNWLSKIIENRLQRQLGHKLHMADLSGLYPPDDDDPEDEAFERVQRSDFAPELDEDRWPNAQIAEDIEERMHEHPPEPLFSPMFDSRGSRGDLHVRTRDVPSFTRVQTLVNLDVNAT